MEGGGVFDLLSTASVVPIFTVSVIFTFVNQKINTNIEELS